MANKREPKQRTQRLPKADIEVPIPKREDVLRDLRKGARVSPRRPKK